MTVPSVNNQRECETCINALEKPGSLCLRAFIPQSTDLLLHIPPGSLTSFLPSLGMSGQKRKTQSIQSRWVGRILYLIIAYFVSTSYQLWNCHLPRISLNVMEIIYSRSFNFGYSLTSICLCYVDEHLRQ